MYFSKSCPCGCTFDSFTGQNAKKRYLLIFTSKYRFLFSTHYSLQETVLSIPHNLPHLFHLLPLQACAYNEAGLIPIPSVHPDLKNGKFTARALDDRLGVYIIMEAIKRAKELGCKVGVYGASTTGEETTKTGAFWTSTRINPTLAIVVDVTYTSDCSGMNPAEMGTVLLGGGPVLCNSPIVVKT